MISQAGHQAPRDAIPCCVSPTTEGQTAKGENNRYWVSLREDFATDLAGSFFQYIPTLNFVELLAQPKQQQPSLGEKRDSNGYSLIVHLEKRPHCSSKDQTTRLHLHDKLVQTSPMLQYWYAFGGKCDTPSTGTLESDDGRARWNNCRTESIDWLLAPNINPEVISKTRTLSRP